MPNERALLDYLCEEIFPQLSPPPYGNIEICRIGSHKPVYIFSEASNRILAVGKLFKHGRIPLDEAWLAADREYSNLERLRNEFGMNDASCEIISPLGKNKELAALLVTRKAPGNLLDHYIARAIYEQRQAKLFQKLTCLARFFARLHGNSRTDTPVSKTHAREVWSLEKKAARWWNHDGEAAPDTEVIVHGDATPTNFFFREDKVTGIDLESMSYADRCWDLGFIAAELKHHFWWRSGDKWAAEPFIGHFLWQYAAFLGDAGFFLIITRRLPLFMALGLARMARNTWLNEGYRKMLIEEARLCLEYG
jgi:hypothetical protein